MVIWLDEDAYRLKLHTRLSSKILWISWVFSCLNFSYHYSKVSKLCILIAGYKVVGNTTFTHSSMTQNLILRKSLIFLQLQKKTKRKNISWNLNHVSDTYKINTKNPTSYMDLTMLASKFALSYNAFQNIYVTTLSWSIIWIDVAK